MAGEHDDFGLLMDFADEALKLAGEFPGHRIRVVNPRGEGLRFEATRTDPSAPGPYLLTTGSASAVREALGAPGGSDSG